MRQCKHCGVDFSTTLIGSHTAWCDKNPKLKERINLKKGKVLTCNSCKVEFCLVDHKRRLQCCSVSCSNKMSESCRDKISAGRKAYLAANPDMHVWKRNDKFSSVPCSKLKAYLVSKNLEFIEEHQPLNDRYYSIDIAFPNIKIGVEVNGNQHYNNDGTLTKYYQDRHDAIVASGWKLIEVHYSLCFNENNYENIFNFDIPFDSNTQIELIKKAKVPKEKPKTLPKGQTTKLKTDEYWETKKDIIFKHDIDFEKFGWVKQVAILLGYKEQYINRWMQRHHPEFYNSGKCFKRSTPTKK